jgi:hypothetical protein
LLSQIPLEATPAPAVAAAAPGAPPLLEALARRWRTAASAAAVGLVATLIVNAAMPDRWQARALLAVAPARHRAGLFPADLVPPLAVRWEKLRRSIAAEPGLLALMRRHGFPTGGAAPLGFRRDLTLDMIAGSGAERPIEAAFISDSKALAVAVATDVATTLIAADRADRREHLEAAVALLSRERDEARAARVAAEAALASAADATGAVPVARQGALQSELAMLEYMGRDRDRAVERAERQRAERDEALRATLAAWDALAAIPATATAVVDPIAAARRDRALGAAFADLEQAEKNEKRAAEWLASLEVAFLPEHPSVALARSAREALATVAAEARTRAARRAEELAGALGACAAPRAMAAGARADAAEMASSERAAARAGGGAAEAPALRPRTASQVLAGGAIERAYAAEVEQLRAADEAVREAKADRDANRAAIADLVRRLEAIPAQMRAVEEREAAARTAREREARAVQELGMASLALEVEKAGLGARLEVIEPALPPRVPVAPNRTRIMLAGVMISLGLGGGSALLAEQRAARAQARSRGAA